MPHKLAIRTASFCNLFAKGDTTFRSRPKLQFLSKMPYNHFALRRLQLLKMYSFANPSIQADIAIVQHFYLSLKLKLTWLLALESSALSFPETASRRHEVDDIQAVYKLQTDSNRTRQVSG